MSDAAAIGRNMDRAYEALDRITIRRRGIGADPTVNVLATVRPETSAHVGSVAQNLEAVAQAFGGIRPGVQALRQTAQALRHLQYPESTGPAAGVFPYAQSGGMSFADERLSRSLGSAVIEARTALDALARARR